MGEETAIESPPLQTYTPPKPSAPPVPVETPPFQTMYTRLVSLDAYRGFIMLAMVTGGLGIPQVARALPDSGFWQFLGYQTDHVAWGGCAFWDLIQPAFMFMVGVAMPYSHASRVNKGAKGWQIAAHTIYRSVLLVLLGVFLSSNWDRMTQWGFANVLCQIGLGYSFVYILIGRGLGWQLGAMTAILVGYTWWFASYSLPPDFNYARDAGLLGPWPWSTDTFFAHWNKNANAAAAFDDWFLNLFPQPNRVTPALSLQLGLLAPAPYSSWSVLPYVSSQPPLGPYFFYNNGGYATLNFIPSMATMILGLMAGEMLRRIDLLMREKFLRLLFAGIACGMLGYFLDLTLFPAVKRIWTPTWALYSAGWTFAMLAGFFVVIDWADYRRWAFPFVVVGMNSIAVYCMAQLLKPWVRDTFERHLEWTAGDRYFGTRLLGKELAVFAPILDAFIFTLALWLIAFWMYRKKIFIKI
jgi:predicted acyltransferase